MPASTTGLPIRFQVTPPSAAASANRSSCARTESGAVDSRAVVAVAVVVGGRRRAPARHRLGELALVEQVDAGEIADGDGLVDGEVGSVGRTDPDR